MIRPSRDYDNDDDDDDDDDDDLVTCSHRLAWSRDHASQFRWKSSAKRGNAHKTSGGNVKTRDQRVNGSVVMRNIRCIEYVEYIQYIEYVLHVVYTHKTARGNVKTRDPRFIGIATSFIVDFPL